MQEDQFGYTISNINDSKTNANVIGNNYIGGLVGYVYSNNYNLNITNSSSKGNVQGSSNVGGLIGYTYIYHTNASQNTTYSLNVTRCFASGNVKGTGNNVGGLIGQQESIILASSHYLYLYNSVKESYANRKC